MDYCVNLRLICVVDFQAEPTKRASEHVQWQDVLNVICVISNDGPIVDTRPNPTRMRLFSVVSLDIVTLKR